MEWAWRGLVMSWGEFLGQVLSWRKRDILPVFLKTGRHQCDQYAGAGSECLKDWGGKNSKATVAGKGHWAGTLDGTSSRFVRWKVIRGDPFAAFFFSRGGTKAVIEHLKRRGKNFYFEPCKPCLDVNSEGIQSLSLQRSTKTLNRCLLDIYCWVWRHCKHFCLGQEK